MVKACKVDRQQALTEKETTGKAENMANVEGLGKPSLKIDPYIHDHDRELNCAIIS